MSWLAHSFGWARLLPIALLRLRTNPGLSLAALLALTASVALSVCVPIYADAASLRLLREELGRQEARSGRPALAVLVRYLSNWAGPLEWREAAATDRLLREGGALAALGLPSDGLTRHMRTAPLPVSAGPDETPLLDLALGFLDLPAGQIQIVEGSPPAAGVDASGAREILISQSLAERVGLNLGDPLYATHREGGQPQRLQLRVSGVWAPIAPSGPAWLYQPEAFAEVLLLNEAAFAELAAAPEAPTLDQAAWLARYADEGLTAATAGPLAGRVERLRAAVEAALPGARLEQSPAAALASYRGEARTLATRLLVFGAPTLALIMLFATLTAGQLVERRRDEIALLKTRGVRDGQIMGLFIIEWLILGTLALLIGSPAGLALAGLLARTSDFLRLDGGLPALAISLTPEHLGPGLMALGVTLAAALMPAAAASRRTLADTQRQAARPRSPLWERAFLDLLLLPPALYGLSRLRASTISGSGADPLLLIVPAMASLALGLIALRILPRVFARTAAIGAGPAWVAPLVALRNLARRPATARSQLLLLMLTLSMAIFSAAVAATSSAELQTAIEYSVGAPTQLIEAGESTEAQGDDGQPERRDIREEPRFLFMPVDEHLRIPGIRAASRVGRYSAQLRGAEAQLIGIDRETLPEVLRGYERAWGQASLVELMNRLAQTPDGVLVSPAALEAGLRVGDRLSLPAELAGDRRELSFTIVGVVALFPGFYPQDGPLVIANLNAIFDQMGGQYPYDVWIDRDPEVALEAIAASVRDLGIDLIDIRDASASLRAAQAHPQRQGLFGLLSIGFLTATGLTACGFVLGSVLTARRQAVELGVLQALGLDGGAVARALLLEQLILVGAGALLGGAIGLLNTLLIVPQLRIGAGPHPGTPPVAARIAWAELGLTAAIVAMSLLLALGLLGAALRRMRLFSAVKLGDM